MKTIEVPKGVQIACGKDIIDGKEVCGGNSYGQVMYCESCQKWNDANCTKDEEVKR